MCYLSGGLFHQNKFPVKFTGPNLLFPWLLVFYYLTDAFVLVLFTSSTSDPHPLCVAKTTSLQRLITTSLNKTLQQHRFCKTILTTFTKPFFVFISCFVKHKSVKFFDVHIM